jgi:hypothetical protein
MVGLGIPAYESKLTAGVAGHSRFPYDLRSAYTLLGCWTGDFGAAPLSRRTDFRRPASATQSRGFQREKL